MPSLSEPGRRGRGLRFVYLGLASHRHSSLAVRRATRRARVHVRRQTGGRRPRLSDTSMRSRCGGKFRAGQRTLHNHIMSMLREEEIHIQYCLVFFPSPSLVGVTSARTTAAARIDDVPRPLPRGNCDQHTMSTPRYESDEDEVEASSGIDGVGVVTGVVKGPTSHAPPSTSCTGVDGRCTQPTATRAALRRAHGALCR